MVESTQTSNWRVLVAGATGGVGQLVVAELMRQQIPTRVLTRSAAKARRLFGDQVEVAIADLRRPDTLPPVTSGISHIICATGTTAFPSKKWDADFDDHLSGLPSVLAWGRIYWDADYRRRHTRNRPEHIDADGVADLINAIGKAPQNAGYEGALQRFVFVSSVGVERKDQLPFSILNAFGVLDAKQRGEAAVINSPFPYTIIRPGRLTDGPYTSYDLNTLMRAKTHGNQDVVIGKGDELNGQASRIDVAAACVACLSYPVTKNQVFELVNQGSRPPQFSWAIASRSYSTPNPPRQNRVLRPTFLQRCAAVCAQAIYRKANPIEDIVMAADAPKPVPTPEDESQIVAVSDETKALVEKNMPDESDQVKQKFGELVEAIKQQATRK